MAYGIDWCETVHRSLEDHRYLLPADALTHFLLRKWNHIDSVYEYLPFHVAARGSRHAQNRSAKARLTTARLSHKAYTLSGEKL